jgi:hypothetical protein
MAAWPDGQMERARNKQSTRWFFVVALALAITITHGRFAQRCTSCSVRSTTYHAHRSTVCSHSAASAMLTSPPAGRCRLPAAVLHAANPWDQNFLVQAADCRRPPRSVESGYATVARPDASLIVEFPTRASPMALLPERLESLHAAALPTLNTSSIPIRLLTLLLSLLIPPLGHCQPRLAIYKPRRRPSTRLQHRTTVPIAIASAAPRAPSVHTEAAGLTPARRLSFHHCLPDPLECLHCLEPRRSTSTSSFD